MVQPVSSSTAEALDRHIEHQSFSVRDRQSTIGHDEERVASGCLNLDFLVRLKDA
jgi:hypothetical protein